MDFFTSRMLDEVDLKILNILQHNASLSNAELARSVNLSPPATHTRVKRLESEGFIDRQVVILNQEKLGFNLLCFIFISTDIHQAEKLEVLEKSLEAMPEVLECQCVTGEYDYILKVANKDRKDLENFIRKLNRLGLTKIQTSLALREVKSSTALPITEEKKSFNTPS
jgi:Lrp/AsnC family transcriptional regulator, leucine-responsive regulatory protein